MNTQRHVALVTGGGQGLGRGIAEALAAAGHSVIVSDIDQSTAELAAAELVSKGATAVGVTLDVRKEEDFARVVSDARSLGGVDILVNNAALTKGGHWMDVDLDEWQDVLDVNLRGALLGARQVVPTMIERGWGRIINMTSAAGFRGGPAVQGVHYATSKAGIAQLTRYLAYDLAPRGITVNAVSPGPILTPQTALVPKDKLDAVKSQVPAGRLGTAEEVGAAVSYLASASSGFVTGVVLDINGGLLMR